jgi:hypothetical protein
MYVSNQMDFGHLINPDNFETNHTNNELYQVFQNRWDWERRYLHPYYSSQSLAQNATILQVLDHCTTYLFTFNSRLLQPPLLQLYFLSALPGRVLVPHGV